MMNFHYNDEKKIIFSHIYLPESKNVSTPHLVLFLLLFSIGYLFIDIVFLITDDVLAAENCLTTKFLAELAIIYSPHRDEPYYKDEKKIVGIYLCLPALFL